MFGDISMRPVVRLAGLSLLVVGLGACSQTTRHSNTLMFGTNTSVGVNVGKDASQTPTVQIGFQRQEAAFVPLLANTAESSSNATNLIPCPATTVGSDPAVPPKGCMFVAESMEDGELTNKDAYSVLASFGGTFGGGTDGAKATVAQYFATGVAAQQLAESGGANVVTAGPASGQIADAAKAVAVAKQKEQDNIAKRLEAEKANAAKQIDNIAAGEIIAKSILGDSSSAVNDAKLTALANKFGTNACNKASMDGLDKRTVKQFMAELKVQKRSCLRELGRKTNK